MVCVLVIVIQVLYVFTGVWEKVHIPVELYEVLTQRGECSLSVSGQVYRKDIRQKEQILYLQNAEFSVLDQKYENLKCMAYDKTFQTIRVGNTVRITGIVKLFDLPRNPGNYDQRFYYMKQGILCKIFPEELKVIGTTEWKVREKMQEFRENWHTMLLRVLGEKKGGMLSAMMTGEKENLDRDRRELYQANGIGHILAISGVCFLCWVFLIGERMA